MEKIQIKSETYMKTVCEKFNCWFYFTDIHIFQKENAMKILDTKWMSESDKYPKEIFNKISDQLFYTGLKRKMKDLKTEKNITDTHYDIFNEQIKFFANSEKIIDIFCDNICVICKDAKSNTLLFPCKHLIICNECFQQMSDALLDKCPLCQIKISHFAKIDLDSQINV
jgi:hypothetical protein